MKLALAAVAPVLFVALTAGGCAAPVDGAGDDGDVEQSGESEAALTVACKLSRATILASVDGDRKEAIERGYSWLDDDVPYSQSRYHDGWRTDCSGFVSMAWDVERSYTTADFINGGGESSRLSGYSSLKPGDALVRRSGGSGHVMLFLGWSDSAKSAACVLEQESTALDMQFHARTTSSLTASGYKAIRADKFE